MNLKIRAYASYFISFLINNLDDFSNLKSIILFGSVARGDAERNSDVDIFIDIKKTSKNEEARFNKILENFYKSREGLMFKAKGIDNKINLIIGKLNEWKDLKKSMENTGIVLYGRYNYGGTGEKKYAIISWDRIEKNRGAFLNKIYGFRANGKEYKGMIEKLQGKKIGKSSIMIPIENLSELEKILKHYKVNAKIAEV